MKTLPEVNHFITKLLIVKGSGAADLGERIIIMGRRVYKTPTFVHRKVPSPLYYGDLYFFLVQNIYRGRFQED